MANFDELNRLLVEACRDDDLRTIDRGAHSIGQRWREEQPYLRPLPDRPFTCCQSREVTLNGYGQVTFETNRYSVPAHKARKQLTLRAYPFQIEILADNEIIATHARSYQRNQDILDPLHYLSLVEQRPGAFEHARPMRQWRAEWPPVYATLLATLRTEHQTESQAFRIFTRILQLHQTYEADLVATAIEHALQEGMPHLSGVRFCLNRLLDPTPQASPLDLSAKPELVEVGRQPLALANYDRFLQEVAS